MPKGTECFPVVYHVSDAMAAIVLHTLEDQAAVHRVWVCSTWLASWLSGWDFFFH